MLHMAVIGTICPNASGHLNPLTTLCRELQRRGHHVIFYQVPLAAEKIRSRGFEVRCFGEKEYPPEEHLKNQQVQVEEFSMGGGRAGELAGMPFRTICDGRMMNGDQLAPPFFTSWRYRTD